MYNLLMTAESDAWLQPTWAISSSRMFEYTHDAIKARFASMSDQAITDLMSFPALFAYERYNHDAAKVGRITSIQRRNSEVVISWSPDPRIPPIPPEILQTLLPALDIDERYEINRTHWAVKEVNLGHVLQQAGFAWNPEFPPQPAPPKVFISYKWSSPERNQWVAGLATALRQNGIEVILDQWHLRFGQNVGDFMATNVRDCDRVIIIYTEDYVDKVENREGGVAYEHMLVTGELMQSIGTIKFIPVIRQESNPPRLPSEMKGRWYVNLADGPMYHHQLDLLLREIHDVPRAIPQIGPNPFGR